MNPVLSSSSSFWRLLGAVSLLLPPVLATSVLLPAPAAPLDLLVELLPAPVVDVPNPRFSWRVSTIPNDSKQAALPSVVSSGYQVQVSLDASFATLIWDSCEATSNATSLVKYAGDPLRSDSVYHWRVRWWVDPAAAPSDWAVSNFTTALFQEADWAGARFIRCARLPNCLYLRSEFRLPRWHGVARASLHVSGLGWVEARLNGAKVAAEAVLQPGWSQWEARVLYTSHDVTAMLGGPGSLNVVGLVLGNGWPGHLGHNVTGKLVLRATLTNGQVFTYATQPSRRWRGSAGPITSNDIYIGESYDAQLEIPGWDVPRGLSAKALAKWDRTVAAPDQIIKTAVMSLQMMHPIRKFQLLPAIQLWQVADGQWVADFGQNIAGWTRLELDACTPGTTVTLRHTENVYPNGTVDARTNFGAPATDVYHCGAGGPVVYESTFTYHGFRYVQVSGLRHAPGPRTLQAQVVHSDVSVQGFTSDAVGQFVAGGEGGKLVTRIMRAIEWTQRDNLYSIPTDCPQRGERQGWMADAALSSEGAMHYFWMPAFYANWLRTITDVQAVANLENDCKNVTALRLGAEASSQFFADCVGTVADTVPHMVGLYGNRPADPSWGVAYPLVYENVVRYYGDRGLAEELYPSIKAFVDWNLRAADTDASKSGLVTFHYYGDWLQPGKVASDPIISTMTSAFNFMQSVRIIRDAATFLGKQEDAARYAAALADKRKAFHKLFYNNGTYADGSQAALTFALHIGAAPNSEVEGQTLRQLLASLQQQNMHVNTGIVATKWMMEVLAVRGHAREALELLLQQDFPSWGFMLANNATTIWEQWNAIDSPSGQGIVSRNHPAFGSVGAWLYRWIGGIRLGAFGHGYQDVVVGPAVVDDRRLSSCQVEVTSSYGPLRVSWRFAFPFLDLQVELPPNTAGHVALPRALNRTPHRVEESGRIVWQAARAPGSVDEAWAAKRGLRHAPEANLEGNPALVLRVGSGIFKFSVRYGLFDEEEAEEQRQIFA